VGTFAGSSLVPSVYWYGSDVVLQEGSGGDATGVGAVTFEGAVSFESDTTQYFTGFSSTPPNSITFNTTGVTVSNAVFDSMNIYFFESGTLMDCNITSYSILNTTETDIIAHITGTNNIVTGSTFAGIDTNFVVQVEEGTTMTMPAEFHLLGSVTLRNYGTWVYESSAYLYFDEVAYWINLGLMTVETYSNDYIRGTQFYSSTYTEVGTFVNMGTLQLLSGGGLNFEQESGTLIQCKNAITKIQYGPTNPGTITLPTIIFEGYIGILIEGDATPSDGTTIFTFIPDTTLGSFSGDIEDVLVEGEPLTWFPLVCTDKTGKVKIYDAIDNNYLCPDQETQILNPVVGGCDSLPDAIKNLQDSATCPATKACGIDTGVASGGNNDGSAANVNVASLAFLVSLVCLLFKF
jgi:hypothetical protein